MKRKITIWLLCILISIIPSIGAEEKYLSLKKSKVNVRYGPSFDSKVKYIYKKINLPIKQIDKKENFRRIVDLKNNSGWIHISQLKKSNSIIILENRLLFKKPSKFSTPIIRLEKGRLLILKKCENDWCNISSENYSGWVNIKNIWGTIK